MCLPKELGGLGLKRVREINVSLLCKWYWRLRENHRVRLVKEKYGVEAGAIYLKKSRLPWGVSIWCGLYKVKEFFKLLMKVEVGDGESTSFWLDRWCSNFSLAQIFMRAVPKT